MKEALKDNNKSIDEDNHKNMEALKEELSKKIKDNNKNMEALSKRIEDNHQRTESNYQQLREELSKKIEEQMTEFRWEISKTNENADEPRATSSSGRPPGKN